MKHIFIVHSFITYLVSRLVIEHLKLSRKEVIFIPFRGFTPPKGESFYFLEEWPYPYGVQGNYLNYSRQKLKSIISFIDAWVDTHVGDSKFSIYASDHSKKLVEILSTHKNCTDINGIEDGLGSYTDFQSIVNTWLPKPSFKLQVKNLVKASNRLVFSGFINKKSKAVYTMSEYAFTNTSKRIIVENKDYLKKVAKEVEANKINLIADSGLFVFDGLEEFSFVKEKEYLENSIIMLQKMINEFGCTQVYIKFHPMQKEKSRQKLKDTISNTITTTTIVYLDNDICIELLLINNPHLKIFGFVSSLLIYAKILVGVESYSMIKWLGNNNRIKLNNTFYKLVTFID